MLITVFTPTYNRAHTLSRTFESLMAQSYRDFEWLIVDDGSTDNTEEVVKKFCIKSEFAIRYIKKSNGGKHTAYNVALEEARGDLFFVVDSDDWLCINSLTEISSIAVQIDDYDSIAGIIALKSTPDGTIISRPFTKECYTATFRELELSGQGGERSIIFKTNIAKLYPFPIIEGERFMPEGVVYDKFNQDYKFVIRNNSLTICEYQMNGLSSAPRSLMFKNPGGYTLYYRNRIDMAASLSERFGYMIRYNLFKHLYRGSGVLVYKGRYWILCAILKVFTPLVLLYYYVKTK